MSPGRGLALNVLTAAGCLPQMEPTRRQGALNHLPPGFLSGGRLLPPCRQFFSAQEQIERVLGTGGPGFESQLLLLAR